MTLRCVIDGSRIIRDEAEADRLICFAAGHEIRDVVSTYDRITSNATPEDSAGVVRPESPREPLRPEYVVATIRRVWSEIKGAELDAVLARMGDGHG